MVILNLIRLRPTLSLTKQGDYLNSLHQCASIAAARNIFKMIIVNLRCKDMRTQIANICASLKNQCKTVLTFNDDHEYKN